jgi:Tfp pilus assembly protein PilF
MLEISRPRSGSTAVKIRPGWLRVGPALAVAVSAGALLWGQQPPALNDAIRLYQAGHLREGCALFRRLAAGRPTDAELSLYSLGCAIGDKNEAAIAASRRALLKNAPAHSALHARAADWLVEVGRCAEAAEEFRLAPPPGKAGAVEYALGQCEQNAGHATQAVERFRKAIGENPDVEEYRLSLAMVMISGGQPMDAGEVLVDAAKRFPRSVRIVVTMSLLHLELGYPDRARLGYNKAHELAPDAPMVWKLLGRIQNSEGAYADAVASFEKAATQEPRDAQTWFLMGISQARLEGGANKALADFQRALELDGDLLEARLQCATIYLQNNQDYARAIAELRRVIAAAPDSKRAHLLLAQAYRRFGQPEKAAAEARKYKELTQR